MMGSRVAAALLWYKLFALSHSSIWLVLYLTTQTQRGVFQPVRVRDISCLINRQQRVLLARVPELHAGAPRAHVFAQQQVVERDGVDAVEELSDHLTHDLRVQTVVPHDAVELSQLSDQGLQGVAAGAAGVGVHAGRPVPVAHGLDPCQAGDALALQHGRH